MNVPSRKNFRIIAIIGAGLYIIGTLFPIPHYPSGSEDVLLWMYYGSLIPAQLLPALWWIYAIALIICSLFFVGFHSWSRWALLGIMAFSQILVLGSGIYVEGPIYGVYWQTASLVFWVPFVLSFFQPCAAYFEDQPDQASRE